MEMDTVVNEDQLSRELAVLRETLADFRAEVRGLLNGFVRQDVYQAQQETMRAQHGHQNEQLRSELVELRATVRRLEEDRRQNRGLVWGALASAAVALAVSFFRSG